MNALTMSFGDSDEINAISHNSLTSLPALNTDLASYKVVDGEFPLVVASDMGPWTMENVDWSEIGHAKPPSSVQNLQAWEDTYAGGLLSQAQMDMASSHQISTNTDSHDPIHEILSQIATERALYMTPPIYSSGSSTFPLSPLSDPYSTPGPSYNPSSWETEQSLTHTKRPRSSPPVSATSSLFSQSSPGGYSSQTVEDEDWFNTLEMPDGRMRRTSNWLPVDSTAGFIIGSHNSTNEYDATDVCHEFQDLQNAFIAAQPVGWPHTR